jgi:hypothetical protein
LAVRLNGTKRMKIAFPPDRPEDNSPCVWAIQQDLLARAENVLGPRNQTKQIYQPVFKADGPYLINTPNSDGAFAALSMNAAGYWPTLVYELAHETVHLLNPVAGCTNWLEEGVVVLFSVEMSRTLTDHPMSPNSQSQAFGEAMSLVQSLPLPAFQAARSVRQEFGSLSAATYEGLCCLFPTGGRVVFSKLMEQCKPR